MEKRFIVLIIWDILVVLFFALSLFVRVDWVQNALVLLLYTVGLNLGQLLKKRYRRVMGRPWRRFFLWASLAGLAMFIPAYIWLDRIWMLGSAFFIVIVSLLFVVRLGMWLASGKA